MLIMIWRRQRSRTDPGCKCDLSGKTARSPVQRSVAQHSATVAAVVATAIAATAATAGTVARAGSHVRLRHDLDGFEHPHGHATISRLGHPAREKGIARGDHVQSIDSEHSQRVVAIWRGGEVTGSSECCSSGAGLRRARERQSKRKHVHSAVVRDGHPGATSTAGRHAAAVYRSDEGERYTGPTETFSIAPTRQRTLRPRTLRWVGRWVDGCSAERERSSARTRPACVCGSEGRARPPYSLAPLAPGGRA